MNTKSYLGLFLLCVTLLVACNRKANRTPLDTDEPLVEFGWNKTADGNDPASAPPGDADAGSQRDSGTDHDAPARGDADRMAGEGSHSRPAATTTPTGEEASHATSSSITDELAVALPTPRRDLPEQRLERKAYISSFNNRTLMPNWVAWKLTKARTNGHVSRKNVRFQEDYDVDERYRVSTFDYNRSGYDRGHLCPAGDNRWDYDAMTECFLMTNICPQGHDLNAGDWNDLENRCRSWARRYGEIYIVCGPIIYDKPRRRIGRGRKVSVPDAFFKVVLCMKGSPKAIGFIFANDDGRHPLSSYVHPVDEVERVTGYDFFAQLPDQVERAVEARAALGAW